MRFQWVVLSTVVATGLATTALLTTGCLDAPCEAGLEQCSEEQAQRCHAGNNSVQTCMVDASGCMAWTDSAACAPI